MVESDYQDLLAGRSLDVEDGRARIRLISGGLDGVVAPTRNHTPVQYLDLQARGARAGRGSHPGRPQRLYLVVEGTARLRASTARRATAGQVLWLDFRQRRQRSALDNAGYRGRDAQPLSGGRRDADPRTVVAYGPFVMNTEDEIRAGVSRFSQRPLWRTHARAGVLAAVGQTARGARGESGLRSRRGRSGASGDERRPTATTCDEMTG